MKAEDLTDDTIQHPKARVVVELPNGQQVTVISCFIEWATNNDIILLLKTGRKL